MIFFPILTLVVAIMLIITSLYTLSLSRQLRLAKTRLEEARSYERTALRKESEVLIALRKTEEAASSQGRIISELLESNNRLEERLTVCQTEKYAVFNNLANTLAEKAEIVKQYATLNEQLKALVDQRRPRTVSHKPAKQQ
jgi:hypothetical protein